MPSYSACLVRSVPSSGLWLLQYGALQARLMFSGRSLCAQPCAYVPQPQCLRNLTNQFGPVLAGVLKAPTHGGTGTRTSGPLFQGRRSTSCLYEWT